MYCDHVWPHRSRLCIKSDVWWNWMNGVLSLLWCVVFENTCDLSHLSVFSSMSGILMCCVLVTLKHTREHCSLSLSNKITHTHYQWRVNSLTARDSSRTLDVKPMNAYLCPACFLTRQVWCVLRVWVCACLYVNNGFGKNKKCFTACQEAPENLFNLIKELFIL